MIEIRLARWDDIPDICRIVQQMSPGLPHDYRRAQEKFQGFIHMNPDYFLWVAEVGVGNGNQVAKTKIVGTAMMHLQHKLSYNCGTAAHLEDVVVDNDFRGQGIGEKLVEKAIETAREKKSYKLMLTCYEKTVPYYEKFGFVKHDVGMRLTLKEELYTKETL